VTRSQVRQTPAVRARPSAHCDALDLPAYATCVDAGVVTWSGSVDPPEDGGPLTVQLSVQSYVQVAAEDADQSRGLLLNGPVGSLPLAEPGDREVVALPGPSPADDPADDQRVGFAGHEVPSGRWGDVDVLGARTNYPLIVPGKEPHRLRWRRCLEGVEVFAHDVRDGAVDVDGDQPVAEAGKPVVKPFAGHTQAVAEQVVEVVECGRPVGPQVRQYGPRTRVVNVRDAVPPWLNVEALKRVLCVARRTKTNVPLPRQRLHQGASALVEDRLEVPVDAALGQHGSKLDDSQRSVAEGIAYRGTEVGPVRWSEPVVLHPARLLPLASRRPCRVSRRRGSARSRLR